MNLRTKSNVTINGTTYRGDNIQITSSNKVVINGVIQTNSLQGPVHVVVHGNVEKLETGSGDVVCETVGSIKTGSGDISCGHVKGSIQTGSGDVDCGNVHGNVKTGSGDVSMTEAVPVCDL